jgi:hypothetical protein
MAYTISVTANYTTVTSVSTQTRVVVTATATPVFTITDTIQNIGITNNLTTITVYTDAVELLVDDFANYFRQDWVSGATYRRGQLVNYEYSLYVCATGTYTTLTSTVSPNLDSTWRRVVWNEAPRDHLTVTNHLSAGSLSVGGIGGTGLTINSTATFNGPVTFNNTVTFSDTATYAVSNFTVNRQFTNNGLADFYGQNATFHTTATFNGRTYITSATIEGLTVTGQANVQDHLITRFLTANDNQHFHADTLIDQLYLQSNWVALGLGSVADGSGVDAGIAIGGNSHASVKGIAIGGATDAGQTGAIAMGYGSHATTNGIAIGLFSNAARSPEASVVIGVDAHRGGAYNTLGQVGLPANKSVIIGTSAGYDFTGTESVVIGYQAGNFDRVYTASTTSNDYSVFIGGQAGKYDAHTKSVAIGWKAGHENQGTSTIAIGYRAGALNQPERSIILNATGDALNISTTGSFVVAPVRGDITSNYAMYYNTVTNEVTYSDKLNLNFGRIVN